MSNFIYSDKIIVSTPLVHDENGYYHLIYCITNTINGKIYIGKHSTKNPYDDYLGSGKHLRRAVKKYKPENFTKELIFCFTDEKEAYLKEKELVTQEFVDRDDTYNVITGGYGLSSEDIRGENNPMYGKSPSKETRDKLSKANSGENNPFYGKKHNQETKDKISKANRGRPSPLKGKHLTQETKDKISKARKGKYDGENNPFYGKKHDQETKDKMSQNHANFSNENHPRAKRVLKIDESGNIVAEYGCIKECCEQEHINRNKMSKILEEHILYNGFYFVIKPKN